MSAAGKRARQTTAAGGRAHRAAPRYLPAAMPLLRWTAAPAAGGAAVDAAAAAPPAHVGLEGLQLVAGAVPACMALIAKGGGAAVVPAVCAPRCHRA